MSLIRAEKSEWESKTPEEVLADIKAIFAIPEQFNDPDWRAYSWAVMQRAVGTYPDATVQRDTIGREISRYNLPQRRPSLETRPWEG